MRAIAFSSGIVLSFSGASAFSNTTAPTPGTPVISAPVKPGECVLACVPSSGGGGITIGGTAPSGTGGTISIGGGTTGGSCQWHCAPLPPPPPPPPPSWGGGGGGGNSCVYDDFFGCTMDSR